MRLVFATIALLLCAIGPLRAAEIDFGRYHALIIGINDYKHLPRLETAVNDASAVHDVLRREYGYQSTLLLNPTRSDLMRALETARTELTEKDNLLLFYAGHGYLDRATNDGFWLPANAEENSQIEWVPVTTVTRMLKASAAKHVLVVVDSCYSGVLTREAPIVLKAGAEREAELQRLSQKRARKALTSGGLEPVYDGGGDGHSVFTRALLKVLRENSEVLDGYQLYHNLRRDVIVNAEQTPEYADIRFAGDEGGDFLLVPTTRQARLATAPRAAAPVASGATEQENLFWQSIQDSTVAADYEAYLAQFPNGIFAPLARARAERYAAPRAEPAARKAAPSAVEAALWESIKESRDSADFAAYLEQYPEGQFAEAARARRQELQQQASLPPAEHTRIELEPVESLYVLLKNANVRERPSVDSTALATLSQGTELYVSGRTPDGKWLKVERERKPLGFIYAPLLQDKEAWEAARRQAAVLPPATPPAGISSAGKPPVHDCDRYAAHPKDAERVADGLWQEQIDVDRALPACESAVAQYPETPRFEYQLGRALFRAERYEAAQQWLLKAAAAQHAAAMAALANLYQNGMGVEQDAAEALKWYRRAAALGYVDAYSGMGWIYKQGLGVGRDYAKAAQYFRKGAELGSSVAQLNLGVMYQSGQGVEKNYAEALKWYRKSADQGHPLAQNNLGWMYQHGLGVEIDHAQAVKWYRLAADRGYAVAQNNLGQMYQHGLGVGRNDGEAARWYRQAADQGDAVGQTNLGWMYQFGRGIEQDFAQAASWYRKAADQGLPLGQNNLGAMYQWGYGVETNHAEAVRLYRLAAEQGNALAQSNLGAMYERGFGVAKSDAEAVKWYRRAAELGDAQGQNNLGVMYETGRAVRQDHVEALKWYRLAAEQDYAVAKTNIGLAYWHGRGVSPDYNMARSWWRAAAALGEERAKGLLQQHGN